MVVVDPQWIRVCPGLSIIFTLYTTRPSGLLSTFAVFQKVIPFESVKFWSYNLVVIHCGKGGEKTAGQGAE